MPRWLTTCRAATQRVRIVARKAGRSCQANAELDSVQLDVLRLIAREIEPPASAYLQVEKLVRHDFIFRGRDGYRLTAAGKELVSGEMPAPLSPSRAFVNGL